LWRERGVDAWIAQKDALSRSRPLIKYQLIRMPEVLKKLDGVTDRTVYYWIEFNNCPKPLKLGRRMALWIGADVDAWLKDKKRTVG